ncbi:hypothetical protein HC928_02640 [bacterium]|nr:hypothetical protein [bacterium]
MRKFDLTRSEKADTQDLFADVDFEVEDTAAFFDVLAVLLKQHNSDVTLPPGRYNLRMFAVVTKED